MKVQAESFHLNGHTIGFRPQTQKLELPHKTLANTLAVKGLTLASVYDWRIFLFQGAEKGQLRKK